MDDATRHKLVWGWLRLYLGVAQMTFAALGVGALIAVGVKPMTWIFVILACAASIISRLIY